MERLKDKADIISPESNQLILFQILNMLPADDYGALRRLLKTGKHIKES